MESSERYGLTSAADKERCEAVTRAAWPSYVELLACLQIA